MIEIKYYGGNSLGIDSGKDKIIINPKREQFGSRNLEVSNNIQLLTNKIYQIDSESRLTIDTPGEYEIGTFSIKGISSKIHDGFESDDQSIIYSLEADEIRVAMIGNIKPELTNEELESIGVVDVLILPVGGGNFTLSAKEAATLVRQIDPKIVLPTYYKDKYDYQYDVDELSQFTNELGIDLIQSKSLKIKSVKDTPEMLSVIKLESN